MTIDMKPNINAFFPLVAFDDMKKIYRILIISLCLMYVGAMLCCCGKDKPSAEVSSSEADAEGEEKDDFTLMVYMCGSDLETKYGTASDGIEQMLRAEIPENVNIVIQTGGSKNWKNPIISPSSTDRYIVKDGELCLVDRMPYIRNFGDAVTLSDFLDYGCLNYPAKKYGLIMWDHGSGTYKGLCFDANYQYDSLKLDELDAALNTFSNNSNVRFDFIGMDACLMANYDVAEICSKYADYLIASAEIEPTKGWDYEALVSSLLKDDFYDTVLESYAAKQSNVSTYTLSVIDLTAMNVLRNAVNKVNEQINYNTEYLANSLQNSLEYGMGSKDIGNTDLYDLGDLLKNMECYTDLSSVIKNVSGENRKDSSGISIYFPVFHKKTLDEYSNCCVNKDYIKFLQEYFSDTNVKRVEFDDNGHIDGDKVVFSLTEKSYEYVSGYGYVLYKETGDGQKILMGSDSDVEKKEDGYAIEFPKQWIYIDGQLLHCDVIFKEGTITEYSAPVQIDGVDAYILFTYDSHSGEFDVEGYFENKEGYCTRLFELEKGMEVNILFSEFSSLEEEIETSSFDNMLKTDTIIWNGDNVLSFEELESGIYYIMPLIKDVYGETYIGEQMIIRRNYSGFTVIPFTST